MARLALIGAETGDLSELVSAGTGTVADGTVVNDGPATNGGAYSYKYTGSASAQSKAQIAAINVTGTVYVRVYFRLSDVSTPANQQNYGLVQFNGAQQACVQLIHGTSGVFQISLRNAADAGNNTTITSLSANTWYRFEVVFTAGDPTGSMSVYQDGTLLKSLTGQSYGSGATTAIISHFANANAAAAGRIAWYDDWAIDDAALPGEGYVLARSPTSGTPTYDAFEKSTGTDASALLSDTPFNTSSFVRTWLSSVAQTALIATFASTQTGHGNGVVHSYDTINAIKTALIGKTAFTTAAGISQVGNILAVGSLNGTDQTLTFSTAPIAGDLVIVWGGHTSTRATPIGPSTSGYALWPGSSVQTQTTNTFGVWYKVMGSTPDTTVVGQGTGSAQDSIAYGCMVLRGVDTSNPSDITIVFANGSSTNPDPGSITPTTTGAAVVICAGTVANDSAWTNPANYSATVAVGTNDNNPYSVGGSVRLSGLTGGTPENPAAFTSVVTGVWIAATIAVRPSVDAGSALSIRSRVGGSNTDTAKVLTTSDGYFDVVAAAPSYANLNSMEGGAVNGNNSSLKTISELWGMVDYTPGTAPAGGGPIVGGGELLMGSLIRGGRLIGA